MLQVGWYKNLLFSVITILFFSLLYLVIKSVIKRIMKLKMTGIDVKRKKTIMGLMINVIKYLFMAICAIMILSVYGVNTSAIVTSLGAVGVVVGLAFQDIIKDLLSGISIIFENQYSVGDTVTISGFKGEVISIGLRSTKIKAYTGEVNIISNRNIIEVINHSYSMSMAIVDIQVSYDEDLDKVEKVLTKLFIRLNDEIEFLKKPINILGVNSLDSSGITYRISVETEAMKHIEVQRILMKEIKKEFDKQKITIPYNQLVIHNA